MLIPNDDSILGIYSITNVKTRECYVGSSRRIFTRLKDHICQLVDETHINKLLLLSWKLHGTTVFRFECLQELNHVDQIPSAEISWIRRTEADIKGFNTKTDQFRMRTTMKIKSQLRDELDSLHMGSMNETLAQLLAFHRKNQNETGEAK